MLYSKNAHSECAVVPDPGVSFGLYVKNKTIRVLLDSGSSGNLLFRKKGSSKCISIVKRVVPQSWGTSNGTFVTDKVGNIEIFFVEYSASKKVHLQPDIIEYSPGEQAPMYDFILGKQTMHDLGVKLDFQEKTITIDEILLPMRNIVNLQLKPRITRSLKENLSWECWQHVGEMSAICQNVDEFGYFCMSVPTPKFPRHKIFVSKISNTVPHTRMYICTKIQCPPQNSDTGN